MNKDAQRISSSHKTNSILLTLCAMAIFTIAFPVDAADNKDVAKQKAAQLKRQEQQLHQRVAALVAQMKPQSRQTLLAELNFLRTVCDIPKEHRAKIKSAGEKSVDNSVRVFAEFQVNPRPSKSQTQANFNPERELRAVIAKELKEVVTPEQFALYESETAKRREATKRAAIDFMVARLDRALWLSREQREKIVESMISHWQDSFENWLLYAQYQENMFPQLPFDIINPHLNAEQRSVWTTLSKTDMDIQIFWSRVVMFNQLAVAKDDYWGEEEEENAPPQGLAVPFDP